MLQLRRIVALLSMLLAACAGLNQEREVPAPVENAPVIPPAGTGATVQPIQIIQLPVRDGDVLAWLSNFRALTNAASEEQRKEFQAAQAAFGKDPGETNRLRLALALSIPGSAWRDDNRLLKLLEPTLESAKGQDSPLQRLGFLLYQQTQERLALREEQKRTETALHDEQRKNDDLKQKLEALRRIDQDIKNRKRTLEKPP